MSSNLHDILYGKHLTNHLDVSLGRACPEQFDAFRKVLQLPLFALISVEKFSEESSNQKGSGILHCYQTE